VHPNCFQENKKKRGEKWEQLKSEKKKGISGGFAMLIKEEVIIWSIKRYTEII
jgi:hypothetical protein